jgi:hypothetical protein
MRGCISPSLNGILHYIKGGLEIQGKPDFMPMDWVEVKNQLNIDPRIGYFQYAVLNTHHKQRSG